MKSTRRHLLRSLAAAFGIVAAKKLVRAMPVNQPFPDRYWQWLRFTGFKSSAYNANLTGQLLGLRNDGQYFYTAVTISTYEVIRYLADRPATSVDQLNQAIREGHEIHGMLSEKLRVASEYMESFLSAECLCGPITGYEDWHDNSDEEWNDSPGETVRIPIYPYCPLHNPMGSREAKT